MKKIAICLLMLLLGSLSGYSQRIILIDKDTMMLFTKPQAAFLLNQVYKVNELDILLESSELRFSNCQKARDLDSLNKVDLRKQIANGKGEISMERGKNDVYLGQIQQLTKEVRGQKVGKWIAIGLGTAGTYGGYRLSKALK